MASTGTDDGGWGLTRFIDRAKTLLMRPKEAWPLIDRDPTPSGELFTRYAAALAAIGPVCGFIAGRVFNWSPFGGHFFGQLFTAVSSYALSMASLLAMSFIASRLATRFGGKGSPRDAFKLIVWSFTAMWLAGATALVPGLGFLSIFGLYSAYLFFTGITPMMEVPAENKNKYGVAVIACGIALSILTGAISNGPAALMGGMRGPAVEHKVAVKDRDGKEHEYDMWELRDLGREMSRAFRDGNVQTVPSAELEALLPAAIGNFKRTDLESVTTRGPGGSHVEATYEGDGKEFTLKIVDLAGAGSIVNFGTQFGIEDKRDDEDGFKHVTMKDGEMIVEEWDKDDHDGKYTTMVAKRFLIEAEGEVDSFDQLRDAAGQIDEGKLEALIAKAQS